jgi:hypothetical protein
MKVKGLQPTPQSAAFCRNLLLSVVNADGAATMFLVTHKR